jgi:hypothetical protein
MRKQASNSFRVLIVCAAGLLATSVAFTSPVFAQVGAGAGAGVGGVGAGAGAGAGDGGAAAGAGVSAGGASAGVGASIGGGTASAGGGVGTTGTSGGFGASIGGGSATAGAGLGTAGGLASGFAAEVGLGFGGLAFGGIAPGTPTSSSTAVAFASFSSSQQQRIVRRCQSVVADPGANSAADVSVCRSLAKLAR